MTDIRPPLRPYRTCRGGPCVRVSDATRERLRAISAATGSPFDALIFRALVAAYPMPATEAR